MYFIFIKDKITAKKIKKTSLIKCLEAQGLYDPPAAEYKPAAPINEINITKKINK